MASYKNKLPPDFYTIFPHIPTEVIDLIILRKCTNLNVRLADNGKRLHSVYVIVEGCGSFRATDKRMQKRALKANRKSVLKGAKKYYKKHRLEKISQFI